MTLRVRSLEGGGSPDTFNMNEMPRAIIWPAQLLIGYLGEH